MGKAPVLVGSYKWVLSLMFLAWAASSAALFYAIRSHIRTVGGKIGLGFLLASAVGMSMASVFDITHNLHGLSSLIGVPTFPVAAVLTSLSLVRSPDWYPIRRALLWTANLTWISLVLMFAMLFIGLSQTGGEFRPGVLIGWPNRLLVAAYCGWLIGSCLACRTAAVGWKIENRRQAIEQTRSPVTIDLWIIFVYNI